MRARRLRLARLLALLTPALLLAGAYGSQVWGGLVACEMCWWQRYAHFAALALALLAFVVAARVFTRLAALAILVGGLIGVFHAGVEYHWWKGLTRCSAAPLDGDRADMLRQILATPLVSCDQPQWTLWHVSLAGWNALFSCASALLILWLTRSTPRHR